VTMTRDCIAGLNLGVFLWPSATASLFGFYDGDGRDDSRNVPSFR